jgi:hypothetical protein
MNLEPQTQSSVHTRSIHLSSCYNSALKTRLTHRFIERYEIRVTFIQS